MNSNDHNMEKLQYPIGRFAFPKQVQDHEIVRWIDQIEELPEKLAEAVSSLNEGNLDTPYRPGGWTIRQVIHHIADSHLNSYIRFKWTLTEDHPTIKSYDQDSWAELPDNDIFPVEDSLEFIRLLHKRWVLLLRSLNEEQLSLKFNHPESGVITLKQNIALYAWHGRHHVAHIVGRH